MTNNEIVKILKDTYPRDIRKQLVKTIIEDEKLNTNYDKKEQYLIINQIFSYVLKELNWTLSSSSSTWDDNPLKIMKDVFPNVENTKWYKEQEILISKDISIQAN